MIQDEHRGSGMRGWALPPPTIILPFTVSMPTSSFLLPTQDSTAHHPCQELPDAVTHRSPGLWANPFRPSCQLYPLLPPLHTHLELPAALEGALAQHFPNLPTPMVRESWESGSVSRWCGLGHHRGVGGGVGRDSPGQAAYVSRNPEGPSGILAFQMLAQEPKNICMNFACGPPTPVLCFTQPWKELFRHEHLSRKGSVLELMIPENQLD